MSVCTFFGHSYCPEAIKPRLHETLVDLIENQSVDSFYVGNHGDFDRIVREMLRGLTERYPHIRYAMVLAYLPKKIDAFDNRDWSDSIFPEGIESIPPRFAISWRNRWMLDRADIVVTYITHGWGGAAQFAELAEKRGKTMVKLGF